MNSTILDALTAAKHEAVKLVKCGYSILGVQVDDKTSVITIEPPRNSVPGEFEHRAKWINGSRNKIMRTVFGAVKVEWTVETK